VITADEIDVLLFDVLGTVVDEAGSMRAELATALDQAALGPAGVGLADAWAVRFTELVALIRDGAPWQSTDELNAQALAYVLRDGPSLPEATVRRLALAGHRLEPWPDAVAALQRLAQRFTIVALSNGNLSMLTDLFAEPSWSPPIPGICVPQRSTSFVPLIYNAQARASRRPLIRSASPSPTLRRSPSTSSRKHNAIKGRRLLVRHGSRGRPNTRPRASG
jgi:hypothetical protein